MTLDAAVTRIRFEFQEMPDLKLTPAQVRRLCDLPEDVCIRAVAVLLEHGVLLKREERLVLSSSSR